MTKKYHKVNSTFWHITHVCMDVQGGLQELDLFERIRWNASHTS